MKQIEAGNIRLKKRITERRFIAIGIYVNVDKLRKYRNEAGYSISEVAAYLGCYKTPTGYWLVEKNQRNISVEVLYKLSKLYGKKMEDFVVETKEH